MSVFDTRLNLLTFPQHWDGNLVRLHVLALPKGDPRAPLLAGTPAFASCTLRLRARVIPGLDSLPDPANALPPEPSFVKSPAGAAAVFDALAGAFNINPTLKGDPRPPDTVLKKYLTRSYRNAFAFDGPSRPFVYAGDAYECALKDPALTNRPQRPPLTDELSWGKVIGFALRQPVLSRALGLCFQSSIELPDSNAFEAGGWLYVDLAPESDFAQEFAAQPALLGLFAARIPPLVEPRSLFAAVCFPLIAGAGPALDEQIVEAERYDDGFARIVHCSQPEHGGIVETEPNPTPIVKDMGIRLGWDDEQIAIWLNRQIDPNLRAPMGVAAYRADVRLPGEDWHSLTRAEGAVLVGSLNVGTFDGEFSVEASPMQLAAQTTGDYWLPSYFATWRGASLVLRNEATLRLARRQEALATRPFTVPNEADIPLLRYGNRYQFRVRLVDLSRGGPDVGAERLNPAPAPEATVHFRRLVPPKAARFAIDPEQAHDQPLSRFQLRRPLLGYPDVVFADVLDAEALLVADLDAAAAAAREPGLPDPDAAGVEIRVEVRMPESPSSSSRWVPLYATRRDFDAEDTNEPLGIEIAFRDHIDVAALRAADPLAAPLAVGPVAVPTARHVRLGIVTVCKDDPGLDYFGSEHARRSVAAFHIPLRAPSRDERELFAPDAPAAQIRALFLQPDPPPGSNHAAGRLAEQLGLSNSGLTFSGKRGKRTVFGCAGPLRHTLAPDLSSITFASASDLIRQWIVAIRLRLNRDWTWDALDAVSFEIERDGVVVGTVSMPGGIPDPSLVPGHDGTDLMFFHAIDPKTRAGDFPAEIHTRYSVRARFKEPPALEDAPLSWQLRLPVAVAPAQTPKLVSAGIALSKYFADAGYTSTAQRRRMLWLEFDSPPLDPKDRYVARVLAYAPDPILMRDDEQIPEPVEPPLPLEPELIRLITPAQPADQAGVDAMPPLIESGEPERNRFALVPLPEGLSEGSAELFGFFVYEIRVGHDDTRWCLAQSRFGPPLRVTGVQHPSPPLECRVGRNVDAIEVDVPYATPVFEGRNLRPVLPSTELWILLYVQVTQADAASKRNVLLERAKAEPRKMPDRDQLHGDDRLLFGSARFSQRVVLERLASLGLPKTASLSVVAVELLPEPASERFRDPLGGDLGNVRMLRTSPLQPVPTIC